MKRQHDWHPVFRYVMEIKEQSQRNGQESGSFEDMLSSYPTDTELGRKIHDYFDMMVTFQNGPILLIHYGREVMNPGEWENDEGILRESRSVTIHLEDEELITSPYQKFFNLHEVEENTLENIEKEIAEASVFEIVDKLDGSVIYATNYHGKLFVHSSKSVSPETSYVIQTGLDYLTDTQREFIMHHPGYTFIFELISEDNTNVVKYSEEDYGLYLIGARFTLTGMTLSYGQLKLLASAYFGNKGVTELGNEFRIISHEDITLEEAIQQTDEQPATEKEGWVINIDGHRIKLKCRDYVNIHKIIWNINSTKLLIRAVVDEEIDDILSQLPEDHRNDFEEKLRPIYEYSRLTKKLVKDYYEQAPTDTRKDFFVWVKANVPKSLREPVQEYYLQGRLEPLVNRAGKQIKMYEIEQRLEEPLWKNELVKEEI